MTQEYNHRPTRRATRAGRNRPELVGSTDEVNNDSAVQETSPPTEESTSEQATSPVTASRPRRLANFFSTVGRNDKTPEAQEVDVAQARIARATRGKAALAPKDVPNEGAKEPVKASTSVRTPPPRRASPFKAKYLIGIVIYLFGAQFIGLYEQQFLVANHLDDPKHPLFRIGSFAISISTLAFLATLILLLLVLARFDLIPRSLGAMTGQQASRTAGRGASNKPPTSENNVKTPPLTMKQGVSGADDDLYQEYRANQRRAKKR